MATRTSRSTKSVFDFFGADSDSSLDFSDDEEDEETGQEDTNALLAERLHSVREGMSFCHVAILVLFGFGRLCASLMIYFSIDLYKVGHAATLYLHNISVYVVFFAFFIPCLISVLYVLALYALIRPHKREPWRLRVSHACFAVDIVLFILALKFWFVTNPFAALALILALPSVWKVLLLRPSRDQITISALAFALFVAACLLLLAFFALFSSIF